MGLAGHTNTFTSVAGDSTLTTVEFTISWGNTTQYSHLANVYVTSSALTWVGFICFVISACILIIDILPCCHGKVHRCIKMLALIACVIATICVAVASFNLFRQPNAMQQDWQDMTSFLGITYACSGPCTSFTGDTNPWPSFTETWGPKEGWYLAWCALLFGIIGIILIARNHHKHGYMRIR